MLPNRLGAEPPAFAHAGLVVPRQIRLGLLTYCFSLAQKARPEIPSLPNYNDPAVFIKEAARIGANAIQIPFGTLDAKSIRTLRDLAARLNIALESTLTLPLSENETARFETELGVLRELGVSVARTVAFPGRRYEDLRTLEAYKAAVESARKRLRISEPIAKRYGIKLAVENHKDQRMDERVQLLQELDSDFIGACIDVGNNIALLEDPVEVCNALLPWALTVHFKDQAVREYENGFLLADVPLGQGCIDLPKIVQTIRAKKPVIHFQLELITRDPLKVPILTEGYWATFPQVKAAILAESWAMIKQRSSPAPFPLISGLNAADRTAAELRNIRDSFRHAAEHLEFSV